MPGAYLHLSYGRGGGGWQQASRSRRRILSHYEFPGTVPISVLKNGIEERASVLTIMEAADI